MTTQPLDHVPASPVVAAGAAPGESKFAEIFASFRSAFKVDGLLLMGLFAAWLFDAMDATIYAYAVPSIIKDLNVSMAEAFSVVSVFLASTAIGGIVIASIGDKIGRKPTVLLSVVLYGIFNFLCGTADSLLELSIYRGLVGFGLGGLWPAAMALVSEIWPAKSRGMAVGVLQTGWTFGLLTAAMFAFTIIPSHGWRWMFYATVVPVVITFFLVLFFVKESPVWKAKRQEQKAQPQAPGERHPARGPLQQEEHPEHAPRPRRLDLRHVRLVDVVHLPADLHRQDPERRHHQGRRVHDLDEHRRLLRLPAVRRLRRSCRPTSDLRGLLRRDGHH